MPSREQSGGGATNVWLTPRYIIDDLGPFDIDPCAAPVPRPWPTAARHIVEAEDGLANDWGAGFAWVNPPYSKHAGLWLAKLATHNNGLALTFARTETRSFFADVWPKSSGVLFVKGRIMFYHPDGTRASGSHTAAPSVIIGYGDEALRRLANTRIDGHLIVSSAAILIDSGGQPVGTWRQAIHEALAGRKMSLRDIYARVEDSGKGKAAKAEGVEWRSKIRRVLQEHFRPVERGVWAPA